MLKFPKILFLTLLLFSIATCVSYGAKYTVNTSGTIKNKSGIVITSPANSVNQSYYNNYNVNNYIVSNQVNSLSVGVIEFVMDYSGSMSNWIEVAKRSMSAILAQIPSITKVGFRVFGHDYNGKNPNGTVKEVKKIIK